MLNFKKVMSVFLLSALCLPVLASCKDSKDNTSSEAQNSIESIISEANSTINSNETSDNVSKTVSDETSKFDPSKVTVGKDVDVITSFPMTFSKITDVLYKMECAAPDGNKLSLTFDKKTWGTWNIGTWAVVDKAGKTIRLAGEGTDWEYVYRAAETATSQWVWSGGNHGNENLVDISFYNGENNEKLDLQRNKPVSLNNLKIVEKTKLHWGVTTNTYCDVTRTYTVVGNQITLDVSYKYTKDVYNYLSYTCMFPVAKTYGLYCAFVGTDDSVVRAVETLKVGKADYSGAQYSAAADRCVMWGYVNPSYKFDVTVKTITASCDDFKNVNKTFYWDMNTTHNKLYFSKYNESSPTLVPKGTEINTSSMWTFYVEQ